MPYKLGVIYGSSFPGPGDLWIPPDDYPDNVCDDGEPVVRPYGIECSSCGEGFDAVEADGFLPEHSPMEPEPDYAGMAADKKYNDYLY